MSRFPIAINTISDTWHMPMEQSLLRLANLNYRVFDVMVSPAHLDTQNMTPARLKQLRRFLDDHELQVFALTAQSLDHNLASPREEIRAMSIAFKKTLIDIAYGLGTTGIVTVSGRYNPLNAPPLGQLQDWLRDSLEQLLPYAEAHGIKLMLENIPMGVLPRAADMMAWADDFNSPSLSICYDVANGHFINEDVAAAIALCAPRLDHVHLSDTTNKIWRHDPLGKGDVDFEKVAQALHEIKYQGMSALEILHADADPLVLLGHEYLANLGWEQQGLDQSVRRRRTDPVSERSDPI